jgi:Tfp pilus assembly protein FimT
LLELMLVMFLLVIALGIVAPFADSLLNPNQVSASIDAVRSQWADTRRRAMEEGRPYRFSVQDGTTSFKIEPDDADATGADAGTTTQGDIPDPCFFGTSPDAFQGAAGPQASSSGGNWRAVVVFLPNGTARDDATLTFGRAGLPPATLKLRALTGAISQVISTKETP